MLPGMAQGGLPERDVPSSLPSLVPGRKEAVPREVAGEPWA